MLGPKWGSFINEPTIENILTMKARHTFLSMIVAGVLLSCIFVAAGSGDVFSALSRVTIFSMLVLVGVSVPLILVSVIKWRAFLSLFGTAPGVWRLTELYLVGYFVNLFLPSQIGGDIARSLSASQPGGKLSTVICTFLERFTGLLAMVTIAAAGLLVTAQPPLVVFVVVLCAVVVWGGAVALWVMIPTGWIPSPRLKEQLAKMEHALSMVRKSPAVLSQSIFLSLIFHTLAVINTQTAAWAIGAPSIPFADLFVIVPLVLILGSVPVTPSGLGVQEGVWVFFLGQVGVSPADSLAISLVLRAKSYLLAAVGGIVVVRDRMRGAMEQGLRNDPQ